MKNTYTITSLLLYAVMVQNSDATEVADRLKGPDVSTSFEEQMSDIMTSMEKMNDVAMYTDNTPEKNNRETSESLSELKTKEPEFLYTTISGPIKAHVSFEWLEPVWSYRRKGDYNVTKLRYYRMRQFQNDSLWCVQMTCYSPFNPFTTILPYIHENQMAHVIQDGASMCCCKFWPADPSLDMKAYAETAFKKSDELSSIVTQPKRITSQYTGKNLNANSFKQTDESPVDVTKKHADVVQSQQKTSVPSVTETNAAQTTDDEQTAAHLIPTIPVALMDPTNDFQYGFGYCNSKTFRPCEPQQEGPALTPSLLGQDCARNKKQNTILSRYIGQSEQKNTNEIQIP